MLFGRGGAAEWFLPILGVAVAGAYFLIPAGQCFSLRRAIALLLGLIVSSIIIFLKPKDYDAHDVEVSRTCIGILWI